MTTFEPSYCPYCGVSLPEFDAVGTRCVDCGRFVGKQPVSIAESIVVREAAVLVIRRAVEPKAGTWVFPGGHVDRGEHPRAAAARELAEETGLSLTPADLERLATRTDRDDEGATFIVDVFVGRAPADAESSTDSPEVDAVAFVSPGRLAERDLFRPGLPELATAAVATVTHDVA